MESTGADYEIYSLLRACPGCGKDLVFELLNVGLVIWAAAVPRFPDAVCEHCNAKVHLDLSATSDDDVAIYVVGPDHECGDQRTQWATPGGIERLREWDRQFIKQEPGASKSLLEVDLEQIESVALRRLVEEVRNDFADGEPQAYNRMHNRHNRSGSRGGRRSSFTPEEVAEQERERERRLRHDRALDNARLPPCPKGGAHNMKETDDVAKSFQYSGQRIYQCSKCGFRSFHQR